MYTYIIEKIITCNNASNDLHMISNLINNAEYVHTILGSLFSAATCDSWRAKNNILYRKDVSNACKFFVQSDVEIDMDKAKKHGFNVTKCNDIKVEPNKTINVKLALATFKPDEKNTHIRKAIKTSEEREAWIKNKLTHNGECEVIEMHEVRDVFNHMEHTDKQKGEETLLGKDYDITLKVKNVEAFNKLRRIGIGPNKSYGFGLIHLG